MNFNIQMLLEKAEESLKAARLLASEGYTDFSASRAYYSMFYATEALLFTKKLSFSSHSAVIAAFGKEFIKTGLIDTKFHRYLIDAQDLRNVGDYGIGKTITPEESKEILLWAREFIETINEFIKDYFKDEKRLNIEILENIEVSDEIRNVVRNSAEKALITEGVDRCELSILLTDDNEIKELNAKYRNVDSSTDVLAFAMREGVDGNPNDEILGDVVISIPTAEGQAKEYGHSIYAELALLTIHGVLHLLGYDHSEKDEAKVMQEKQKEIIHSLGYMIDDSKLAL